ncbi:MAG: carbohydrate binding domain-containing protein, partial [Nanoarchaeota archaeon]|nr:carbohydrate binding domain-containing protein [Nanoarchaeota archaeon]
MNKKGEVTIIFGILFLVILLGGIYLFNPSNLTGHAIVNPNFETPGAGWDSFANSNVSYDGTTYKSATNSLKINGYGFVFQQSSELKYPDADGKSFDLSFWAKRSDNNIVGYAGLQGNQTYQLLSDRQILITSTSWQLYSKVITLPTNDVDTSYVIVLASNPASPIGSSVWFDDVSLTPVIIKTPGQACSSDGECSTGICGAYNSNSGNVCLNACSIPTDCSNINPSDACVYGKCVQGKVVKLLARDVEISSCEEGLTITCTTDLGTDSIEPWWNFTGNLLDFNQGVVDGKAVSTFLVNISSGAGGVYGAGCNLNADWSRGYTDLNVPATIAANPSLLNISNYNIPSCGVNSNFIIEGQNVYPSNTGQKSNATSQCNDFILKVTNSSGNVKN